MTHFPAVYVFGVPDDNLVKVGFSAWPSSRLSHLRSTERMRWGEMLYLHKHPKDDLRWLERQAHRYLAEHCIYDRGEWFLTTADVAIDAIQRAADLRKSHFVDGVLPHWMHGAVRA